MVKTAYALQTLIVIISAAGCASNRLPQNNIDTPSMTYRTWDSERYLSEDFFDWRSSVQERYDLFPDDEVPHWVFNNIPQSAEPVFLGVAFPHVDSSDEYNKAVEYAVDQALRYNELIGYAQSVYIYSSLGNYFANEVEIRTNPDLRDEFKNGIRILSIYKDKSGTYLLADFPGVLQKFVFPQIPKGYSLDVSAPLPDVPGFNIALGISRKYIRLSDTLMKADEQALYEIMYQKQVHITSDQEFTRREEGLTRFLSDRYEYSTGRIRGFYILARWRDRDYYYSLAVAPIE